MEKNIIVTVDLDKDGNDKHEENGDLSCRFKIPTDQEWDSEWKLVKLKTERDLSDSKETVGSYIYDSILRNPSQKIIGRLVRTIERKFYKEELRCILKAQVVFHAELQDKQTYMKCVECLYANNDVHRKILSERDFVDLFVDDIIFYQRPLKSKKSLIANCPYESNVYDPLAELN